MSNQQCRFCPKPAEFFLLDLQSDDCKGLVGCFSCLRKVMNGIDLQKRPGPIVGGTAFVEQEEPQ